MYPFQTRVSSESSAVGRWHTTRGGGVIAVGTGGGLTGWRGDLLVADDLFAGRAEADSQAVRDSVWAWWSETAMTRLRPESAILATSTRWHEDDLCGRLLNSEGADEWTVVNLPAIAEDDDPLGRKPGEALWPTVYNVAWLDAQRREIGERSWAALYQGRPTPAQGAIFLREWLGGRYSELPDNGLSIVTAVDASFGKSVQSDYSAIVTVASNRKAYYVLHASRGRWPFNELCEQVKKEAAAYGAAHGDRRGRRGRTERRAGIEANDRIAHRPGQARRVEAVTIRSHLALVRVGASVLPVRCDSLARRTDRRTRGLPERALRRPGGRDRVRTRPASLASRKRRGGSIWACKARRLGMERDGRWRVRWCWEVAVAGFGSLDGGLKTTRTSGIRLTGYV